MGWFIVVLLKSIAKVFLTSVQPGLSPEATLVF